jgi:hypothetical protein
MLLDHRTFVRIIREKYTLYCYFIFHLYKINYLFTIWHLRTLLFLSKISRVVRMQTSLQLRWFEMIKTTSLFYDRKRMRIKLNWTKLKKSLNSDDISHRMKLRTLIWQLRINFVTWDEKKFIERATSDSTSSNALERQTNLRVYYVVDVKTI